MSYRRFEFYKTPAGNCPVKDYLEKEIRWNADRVAVLEMMRELQEMQTTPSRVFKKLQGHEKVWEVRVFGERNDYRVLCWALGGGVYLATNVFAKKSQATPEHEIDVAKRRAKEYAARSKP